LDTECNRLRSPWLRAEREPRPPLAGDVDVEVAVVGGGIVGVAAAHHLAEQSRSVALLEARTVGSGVTGNSTAKLSALQGTVYSTIASKHGEDTARAYAKLNRTGVEGAFAIAESHGVDCRLERRPAFTYTEEESKASQVEQEAEAASATGLAATVTTETDLPFDVAAAVRVDDQAQFDPGAWCRGVADALAETGVQVFEHTRATKVREHDRRVVVTTALGARVTADHVIVATHMPILDRGLFFARTGPKRSYAVAGPAGGPVPQGMYLSVESPTRSIRSFADLDGTEHVIVGGEGHKTGFSDPAEHYRSLEADLTRRFAAGPADYRWAAHDLVPIDQIPFIGQIAPWNERILTATGFNKWGLAAGIAAADALADRIAGRRDPYEKRFDTNRLNLKASLGELVKERGSDALRFFGDRLRRNPSADLVPGEGRIVASGLGQQAVYREDDGTLHRLSARCTHVGCIVAWNPEERTWDCPCHGSRFEPTTGDVIQGPAVNPLPRK
jgi:glycine/D-amino acid oxidase-like deaminating enzyme/nitrite reductase/ring-hydroxylating ferredoxin subunit